MKKWISLLLIALLGSVLAACNDSETNAEGEGSEDGYKVGLAMNTLNNPFFVTLKEGAEEQAKNKDIQLEITDSQGNPGQQMTDVENLLQSDLDVLILNPVDSDAAAQAVMLANERDVPVITVDRQAAGGEVVSHIGFDALKSGEIAATFLEESLNGEGKVVELQGILGTNVGRDRSQGFNNHMESVDGIEIIAQQSANFDRGEALSVMEDILQANDEIDGVYAANDEMVMGALSAIESAGRLDEMVVIGTDAIDPAMEAIREGKLEATIAEPPFFLGRDAVDTAIKVIEGEEVKEMITLENKLVTKENVDEVKTR
ncbi:substrate-binding domain-containing protein [Halobacillus litoralis]|uniref:substrate-binding domain-containing protein n=1 Tax=Halobacillus litoralis TaxID=45668 RepID=UPI001CFED013|nr:substrate-binding domain-containing protein [Halobacillus litoralis]